MLGLRRTYHRRLGPQQRFLVAAAVTIVAVAYVVVPWVSDLLEGLANYTPGYYEPKDFARAQAQRPIGDLSSWSTDALVNAGLFVLLAVVWFMSVSGGRPGGGAR